MRHFNTTGPVKPDKHYCIPPLARLDLDEVLRLVHGEKYFVLHAPRQTGKTSALLALRDLLNGQGYQCLYTTVEAARTARDDVQRAMRAVLSGLGSDARVTLGDEFLAEEWSGILAKFDPDGALGEALTRWAQASPKPLVLLIDEIDTLQGDPLLSALQQLRAGYPMRPEGFPQCVVLCGLRDVRDYRIRSTSSPFNIVAESLRLGDFTHDLSVEVAEPAATEPEFPEIAGEQQRREPSPVRHRRPSSSLSETVPMPRRRCPSEVLQTTPERGGHEQKFGMDVPEPPPPAFVHAGHALFDDPEHTYQRLAGQLREMPVQQRPEAPPLLTRGLHDPLCFLKGHLADFDTAQQAAVVRGANGGAATVRLAATVLEPEAGQRQLVTAFPASIRRDAYAGRLEHFHRLRGVHRSPLEEHSVAAQAAAQAKVLTVGRHGPHSDAIRSVSASGRTIGVLLLHRTDYLLPTDARLDSSLCPDAFALPPPRFRGGRLFAAAPVGAILQPRWTSSGVRFRIGNRSLSAADLPAPSGARPAHRPAPPKRTALFVADTGLTAIRTCSPRRRSQLRNRRLVPATPGWV